jgi:hypothetical protein
VRKREFLLFLLKFLVTGWGKKKRRTPSKKISFAPPKEFLCEKLTKILYMVLQFFFYFSICEFVLPTMKIKLSAFRQGITHQKRQTFWILKRPNNKLTRFKNSFEGAKKFFF